MTSFQDHGGPVGNDARRAQLDLFCDYRTNAAIYPAWQARLRRDQPRTLIFWGQGDIFFISRIQSDAGMAAGKGRGSDPTQNLRRPRLNS
ncbi:hypothetical protein [Kribbella sp. VKM Ac-2566]|nr:hypothetical protein [Kribbella sp. VKM Ac-2566]